ncbi:MAG TPA: hypothetical protein VGU46_01060 [Acidobacteriaceae bacterium]|nr:hypothetical protein [Acidobacteriaceae bacterium]
MDRREFISLTATAVATVIVRPALAQSPAIELTLPSIPGPTMPAEFTGLSYEMAQIYNPNFFSPSNTPLITAFRNLSPHGVLRLGGHLSNITPWEGVGQQDAKQLEGVRHGIEDYWEWPLVDPSIQKNKHGIISRAAIRNLRAFLDATNWRLIYTLNFASGSPARAVDEAAFVSRTLGPRLIAFVLGNEVDGYGDDPVFRAKGYDFDQYFAEYQHWTKTIRAAVPHAPFAGPETEHGIDTWLQPFARRTHGEAALLTTHYYGMGPASDPTMTAHRLLQKHNPELDKLIAGAHAATHASGGTPYRLDEAISCYGGGRPGVSDTFASALWVADFMLAIASAGIVGVNLHGGGTGFYTPIETSAQSPAAPRPSYFGMQFAQRFSGFAIAPCPLATQANLTAYLGTHGPRTQLALINKGPEPVTLTLPNNLAKKLTHTLTLKASTLDAKTGTTLSTESAANPDPTKTIPAYTALLFLES